MSEDPKVLPSQPQEALPAAPPEAAPEPPPETPPEPPPETPPEPPPETLAAEDIAEVRSVALRVAKGGNVPAIAVVERMWRQRDRSVVIDLPPITDAVSLAEAHARVIARAAGGKITPRQGVAFATMLEWRRRAMEAIDFERQLEEIDEARAQRAAEDAKKQRRTNPSAVGWPQPGAPSCPGHCPISPP